MKSLLIWLCSGVIAFSGEGYRAAYTKLKEQVPEDKMEAHLKQWRETEPGNPDAWILSANWFFEKAQTEGIVVSKKPAEKDDFVLTDPKTGKAVGSLSSHPNFDPKQTNEATGFLRTALERWPHRLDIHCGLAEMLQTTDAWKEELEALRVLAETPRKYPGQLRWCYNEPLDSAEEPFVARKLHGYALHQFQRETPEGDAHFHELANLLVEVFPNEPYGYNDLAVFHGLTKNWSAAQAPLETAAKVAPGDALVWSNLGDNSIRLGDRKRARAAFEKVVQLDTDPRLTVYAKKELTKLNVNPTGKRAK